MTDATAPRGGVGIRLFVEGATVVRRTFDQIADSGKKMWSEIAMGERAANPAVRALSLGVGEARQGMEGLASRAGIAGSALSAFGFVGVALAAVLGTVAIAATAAFAAMGDAAALTDTADRIGVTVERLQEWRYVADEAGLDAAKLEGGMERLNGVLGRFKMGIGDGKLKPVFEELGITKEQLDDIETSDQLLNLLADTLGQVEDRAKQVALARSLGIEELLPALRLGSQGLADLRDEAHELGLVMSEETVAALDEADRKMELAGQQFKVMKDTALAPLAEMFGNAAQSIAQTTAEISNMTSKLPAWQQAMYQVLSLVPGTGLVVKYLAKRYSDAMPDPVAAPDPEPEAKADNAKGGGFELQGHDRGSGRGGSSASSAAAQAKREEEQRRSREARAADRLARAADDLERAQDRQSNMTIEVRYSNQIAELERERDARLREIARDEEEYKNSNGLRGLSEAEAEKLKLNLAELHAVKDAAADWERRRSLSARRLKDEEDAAAAALDMLEIDSQLATTSKERARIEREILLSTQAIARKRREAELENDPELTVAERSRRMGIFDRNAARQVDLFDETEHRRMLDQFKGYGREVVDAIKQGRIGEYIGTRIQEKLLDGALEQLFNLAQSFGSGQGQASGGLGVSLMKLFGSGGSASTASVAAQGGSGFLGSVVSGITSFFGGGGRLGGGSTGAGRFYQTAENGRPELFMLGGQGHVTSAAETVRILQESLGGGGGSGSGSAPVLHQSNKFDFKGAVVTQDLIDHANRSAESAAQSAFSGARDVVPSDRAKQDRYTRGRR